MNATSLLKSYERVADAPDAVGKLRLMVLDLAIRGKLEPQDVADEPAGELLGRILAVKKSKSLKRAGTLAKAGAPGYVVPFAIPDSWKWSQLAEVGDLSPRNEAAEDSDASFVPMAMISADYGIPNQHSVRPWKEIKNGYSHFAEGDVGLAKITPCFENRKSTIFRNLTGGFGAGTTELHVLRPILIEPGYVLIFLKSPYFIDRGIPRMTGTAGQKRIPAEYFARAPFPLPPLVEQHRIVAKVDELMALCDQLEAARTERESARDRLTAATLARLNAPDPDTFQSDARFALNVLPALSARPDQLKQLRQTILNLAVRGTLVSQDPLERVAEPYARTAGSGFPPNWGRLRFGDHCDIAGGNQPPKEQFRDSPLPDYVRLFQIRDLGASPVPTYIPRASTNRFCEPGEILIGRYGASVGKVFWAQRGAYNVALAKFIWPTDALSPNYAYLLLQSEHFQAPLRAASRSAQAGFNKGDLLGIEFPLPPLAEQDRIVAKVDELMALSGKLEDSLMAGESSRSRLLDALLHEALEPIGSVAA